MRRAWQRHDAWTGASARAAALAAVVLFHGCVVLALVTSPSPDSGYGARDTATLVRFIERPRKTGRPAQAGLPAMRRHDRSPPAPATVGPPRLMSAEASPGKASAAGNRRPLRLMLPPVSVEIPDSPLRRADRSSLDTPERLHVEIVDRSLGGTLQRMARASACGELRGALLRSPASAAAIRKSMERYHCSD